MFLSPTEFIGHFHPLLVHLPIGILLVALLLQWLSRREKYRLMVFTVPFLLLLGTLSAVFSCISGYCLSLNEDYDEQTLNWHMYMGISVAFVSFVLYAKERNPAFGISKTVLAVGLLVLIFITGHLGGSLTHGADYLVSPLQARAAEPAAIIKKIPDLNKAFVYADVVQPIFESRCYSCHGPRKQKGKLRLDDPDKIMAGGKDGKVIIPGLADSSEMIRLIQLPLDNEDHMPPKGKLQVTNQQIDLLKWWINEGADFKKKVSDLNQPEKIKSILLGLQSPDTMKGLTPDIPEVMVEKGDSKIIETLNTRGFLVQPVSSNSNWLELEMVNDSVLEAKDFQNILLLKKQLIWLKLNHSNIRDADLQQLAEIENLSRLNLANTNISDQGVKSLSAISSLRVLNLAGTKVSADGVAALKSLKNLRQLFLYQSPAAHGNYSILKSALPQTHIDTGGYQVPLLKEDTTLLKAKQDY